MKRWAEQSRALFLVAAILSLGLGAVAHAGSPRVMVELSRSACFGTCPVYSVRISRLGRVTYEGRNFVRVKGHAEARIDPRRVREFVRRARRLGFFRLRDAYRAGMTDMPTYTLSITDELGTKTVEDYAGRSAGMPAFVSELEAEVDRMAGTARWTG